MHRQRQHVDVFGYRDYRAYLKDVYSAKKAEGRGFSFRAFSRRAGLQSPNHLKRVIDGERNLTPEMTLRYAAALGLNPDETSCFADLVTFTQATTDRERNAALERLSSSRGYRRAQKLELAHADYHAHWWIPAIREMAMSADFRADAAWIAGRMLPAIPVADAQRALDTLFELGLLRTDADGRIVQGEPVVTTGPETRGLHVRNYHRAMLERAAESMQLIAASERDISSLTFCADDQALAMIKQRIQDFRRELIATLSERPPACDRVLQLNFQLFPLTKGEE